MFFNKSTVEDLDKNKTVVVISKRKAFSEDIANLFHLSGYNDVEIINSSYNEITENINSMLSTKKTHGVVIDALDDLSSDLVCDRLQMLVPINSWCIVVGDVDSISVVTQFNNRGYTYLNLKYQRERFVATIKKLANGESTEFQVGNEAVIVSFLGCKGGVGNSSICFQQAKMLAARQKVKTLYIQSGFGSKDLDLIANKDLNVGINNITNDFDVFFSQGDLNIIDVITENRTNYSFIICDACVSIMNDIALKNIVSLSSLVVVVTNRSLSSLRVARNVIDIYHFILRTAGNAISRRMLVCLNDLQRVSLEDIGKEDIEVLLGNKIDVHASLHPNNGNKLFKKHHESPMDILFSKLIGFGNKRESMARSILSKIGKG